MYEQPPPYSGIGPDHAPYQLTHRRGVYPEPNSDSNTSANNPTAPYPNVPPPYPLQAGPLPQKKFD